MCVRPSSDNLLWNEEIVSSLFILLFNITKQFDRVLKLLNAQIFNHKRDICLNTLEHHHPTSCSFDKKEMICHTRCSLYHTGILLFLWKQSFWRHLFAFHVLVFLDLRTRFLGKRAIYIIYQRPNNKTHNYIYRVTNYNLLK